MWIIDSFKVIRPFEFSKNLPHLEDEVRVIGYPIGGNIQAGMTGGTYRAGEELKRVPLLFAAETPETRKLLEERTRSVIDHVCKANGAQYKLDYVLGYPSIQNNEMCIRDS